MHSKIAIEAINLTKKFILPSSRHFSFKSKLLNIFRPHKTQFFNALCDINFKIKQGDFVSIIGPNGSGKTTLFKVLSSVIPPTSGKFTINGQILSMLELGIGFQPELSAIENIYLSGSLLGISKSKIDQNLLEILSFADLEEFQYQKLKNFSSGMKSRLAFSIARQGNGDIILCDEVLAVGDEAFQQKCLSQFKLWHQQGKTILFITHSLDLASQISNSIIYLKAGKLLYQGNPNQAITQYLNSV